MGLVIGALKVIIVIGTLVTIHELSHFLVAKACHVRVLKFAIGFGPKILTKHGKETEYTLRLIPLGGFVQLEGEEGESSQDERAFHKRPIYQRILIVGAGATVNILFALVVYFFIATSTNYYYSTTLTALGEETPEYQAGLRSGDTILRLNGKKILVQYDFDKILENAKDDIFVMEVARGEETKEISVPIPMQKKGLLGIQYNTEKQVVYIAEGRPVTTSGLQSGDVILAINGETIENWQQIGDIIGKIPDEPVTLTVARGNEEITIQTETISVEGRFYQLGFSVIHPQGFSVVMYAWNETGDYWNATIEGLLSLVKGKNKNIEVMGPVGIVNQISSTSTVIEFFYLMSAISLSLGIFNLLPIPGLDGGKILILIIEKIRKKPMKQETEAKLTLIGFSLILLLAIIVTYTDVSKIFMG